MSRHPLRLRFAIAIASGVACFATATPAQEAQSSQSVAEAAARAKEAKKKSTAKSKVLTEDDLSAKTPKAGDQGIANPQGETTAPPAAAAATGGAAETAKEKPSGAKKEDDPEVVRLKAQLAEAEQDFDLAKREAALANDTYYSNPDHARDTAGKAKLDGLQQQVNDKQRVVQELKDKLTALGVAPTSAAPAAPPAPRN